jgi:hypothetical protein
MACSHIRYTRACYVIMLEHEKGGRGRGRGLSIDIGSCENWNGRFTLMDQNLYN